MANGRRNNLPNRAVVLAQSPGFHRGGAVRPPAPILYGGEAMSNETKSEPTAPSRRLMLRATVVTLGAAAGTAAGKPVTATVKISKAAVGYQDHPQGDKRCEKCLQFEAPNACKLVDGPINPQGFCRIFSPSRQAALPTRTMPTRD
jgi:hypothetical protein